MFLPTKDCNFMSLEKTKGLTYKMRPKKNTFKFENGWLLSGIRLGGVFYGIRVSDPVEVKQEV